MLKNFKKDFNFCKFYLENQEGYFKKIKIGVFNSSSNLSYKYSTRVKQTLDFFNNQNIKIYLGNLTFKKGNYRSGTILQRANEFNQLLKKSNIMLSMIGGFNSSSLLPHLNYDYIKENKLKIVGCSDITSILLSVFKKTGIATYYGPSFLMSYYEQEYIQNFNFNCFINQVVCDFNSVIELPQKITRQRYDWKNNDIINKKLTNNIIKTINVNEKNKIICGRLIGGNLNTMASLIGTEYMPDFNEEDILFIEDSFVNASTTERNMSVLKNAKILNKVSAIIIGLIEEYDDLNSQKKYHEILLEFLDKKIPIMYDFPCSHIQPSTILKIGGIYEINFESKTIKLVK